MITFDEDLHQFNHEQRELEYEQSQERIAYLSDPDLSEGGWGDAKCESGWTGDRCTYKLFHAGDHSNA